MNRQLICIIGLDGAGKTTQSKMLVRHLESSGLRAVYRYGRFVPLLSRPVVLLGSVFVKSRVSKKGNAGNYREFVACKRGIMNNQKLSKLVEIAYSVDYSFQLFIKVAIPLRLGYTVVCDRYVHDTIATDIAPDLSYDIESAERVTRRLLRLFRTPDLLVYLRLAPENAYARKYDVPDLEYLTERAETYDRIASRFSAHIVNGGGPITAIQDEILSMVNEEASSRDAREV